MAIALLTGIQSGWIKSLLLTTWERKVGWENCTPHAAGHTSLECDQKEGTGQIRHWSCFTAALNQAREEGYRGQQGNEQSAQHSLYSQLPV